MVKLEETQYSVIGINNNDANRQKDVKKRK